MRRWLRDLVVEDLEAIPGRPSRVPGVQVVKEAHPESYAQMPVLQHAIARVKWGRGIKEVVRLFRDNMQLRQLATDPVTGEEVTISQNGVKPACLWFYRGIPWHAGRGGGRCPMVNVDQVIDLRSSTREELMEGQDLAEWLLERKKSRFTPILKEVLGVMLSPEVAEAEDAAISQDTHRARDWARGWLRANGMHLKRADALETERWPYCTRGTISRWFDELTGVFAAVKPEMLWNMDEVMVAASRHGMVVVSPNQVLFVRRSRKTPHVTVAPCFNPRGDATPPLLVFPGPKRLLQELDVLHQRALWVAISNKGWVDRAVFRQWCQLFASWMVQKRREWGKNPQEPAILVLARRQ